MPTLTSIIFLNKFSKFLWLSCSKFPGLLNKGQKVLYTCSRILENDKKQSGPNNMGHPVCRYVEAECGGGSIERWCQCTAWMGCRVDEAGVAVHSVRRSGLVSSVAPTLSSDPRLLPAGAQPHTEAGSSLRSASRRDTTICSVPWPIRCLG